ncbi:hypothetical protein TSL6_03890 [Sulfurovum sp. TSL6]|uniref:hypothetical protein n=1 Tax=Sulfurovum sp. TSL6 TaxID=2826995 RepID=UPI001CC607B8|nr:hypothetical protein [Sulfurovum sp. TSL6]GIT99882.1 hypothetical protein TSL6_03890 [Sulfurovum sp. TSL6]
MKSRLTITLLFTLSLLAGCTDKEQKGSITEDGMKCGPGKCGASMVDGSALLVKKKMNILNQLEKEDNRRNCVLKALTTKEIYDCVRVKETGRLSTKCSSDNTVKVPKKELLPMKCETGKCTGS